MILHEDLRRSVGQCVDGEGHTIGGGEDLPRETKVGQKDVVIVRHQKIIEFDVTVNDITTMEEVEDFHDLVDVNTKNLGRETILEIERIANYGGSNCFLTARTIPARSLST